MFVDINMPGMDGFETTKRVIEICKERGITPPVILGLTGDGSESTKTTGKEMGMTQVLVKPLEKDTLLKCFAEYV